MIFYSAFFISLLLGFYKIVFGIGFSTLPVVCFTAGLATYIYDRNRSVRLFIFLFPVINSLPLLFIKGYPNNYLPVTLFWLGGLVCASALKKEKLDFEWKGGNWYKLFLVASVLSVVFVFLRWSNIFISAETFMQDTQITPQGDRVSFGSLFPVLSLMLISIPPFLPQLIKKAGIKYQDALVAGGAGLSVSFIFAVIQKFFIPGFLTREEWVIKMGQVSGGASDFNGFGFLSGVFFLLFVLKILKRDKFTFDRSLVIDLLILTSALGGIVLSGSRSAFVFLLAGGTVFLFSRRVPLKYRISAVSIALLLIVVAGGTVRNRVAATYTKFSEAVETEGLTEALDRASNGRVVMLISSWEMMKDTTFTGTGFGNFLFYLKKQHYQEKHLEDMPLNQFLMYLDELGIIGLILFTGFAVLVLLAVRSSGYSAALITVYIVSLVGTFFWLPEGALVFWLLLTPAMDVKGRKLTLNFSAVAVALLLLSNLYAYTHLKPVVWAEECGTEFSYGFWKTEKNSDGVYRWTKSRAGIMVGADVSRELSIFCGAPVGKLNNKEQAVELFWNGDLLQKIVFKENRMEKVTLPQGKGMLDLKVEPDFNLRKMKLSNEPRDLGIMFFYPFNS